MNNDKKCLVVFLISGLMISPMISSAEPITVGSTDNLATVLKGQIGKKVSIRTSSGSELSGKIVSVNGGLTHLGQLTGKEFYDAVIVNTNIESVTVRVK